MTHCTADALGKMLHLSAPRIRQLTQLGIIPKAGHGQYELEKAVESYVLYLRASLARQHATRPVYHRRPLTLQELEESPIVEPTEKVTWVPLNLAQQVIKEQLSLMVEELGALPIHKTRAIGALKTRQALTVEKPRAKPNSSNQEEINNSLLHEAMNEMESQEVVHE